MEVQENQQLPGLLSKLQSALAQARGRVPPHSLMLDTGIPLIAPQPTHHWSQRSQVTNACVMPMDITCLRTWQLRPAHFKPHRVLYRCSMSSTMKTALSKSIERLVPWTVM